MGTHRHKDLFTFFKLLLKLRLASLLGCKEALALFLFDAVSVAPSSSQEDGARPEIVTNRY